ncbi:MAG: DUF1501 domain-containing protein, partial [Alphaproteobacteria bacterium]|nr:DUF1501 domain-containing protein [Alphaproteobacteria bacterium]
MTFTRRDLLRTGLAAGAAVALEPGLGRLAFAADGPDRGLLVIVHLRGGCDGLNLISPATDPDFIAARNSDLRVAADGQNAGHALANGPDAKIDFRLHAAANGLAELYNGGQLAFIHAAGLTDGTRSHFVATDMIEHGVAGGTALARTTSGWLTRYQQALGLNRPGTSVSAAGAPSGEFQASTSALAVPDLGGGFGAPGGPQVNDVLQRLYAQAQGPAGGAGRASLAAMQLLDQRVLRDAQSHPQQYTPEHNVNYDPAGDLGRPLKTVAQIAKMEIGLQVATVDIGGWDTHENQPGRFNNAVARLSTGISAFYEDMWRYHDRLILVTVSEFGRRLRSNRSNGTDHGRAGVMAVLGGKVAGGRMYGRWPGLHSEKLDEGVDLAVATDYRQVLTEV